jgi:hypothetical protein
MESADCITGTSVGQLDEVVENAEQTDFWRTKAEKALRRNPESGEHLVPFDLGGVRKPPFSTYSLTSEPSPPTLS